MFKNGVIGPDDLAMIWGPTTTLKNGSDLSTKQTTPANHLVRVQHGVAMLQRSPLKRLKAMLFKSCFSKTPKTIGEGWTILQIRPSDVRLALGVTNTSFTAR